MNPKLIILTLAASMATWTVPLYAGEHPHEHPTGQEHPSGDMKEDSGHKHEHPKKHPKKSGQSKEFQNSFEKIVKDYLESEAQKSGGVYTIKDDVANKEWKLKLDKVHKSKICMLQEGKVCFACADFMEVGGKNKLDLDFYAEHGADGSMTINKVMIHKVNGKPRFTYDKDNNIVPVK